MPTNRASLAKGATAAGDGAKHDELIDDTEGDELGRAGRRHAGQRPAAAGDRQPGRDGSRPINRAQVSAMLEVGQNRFTALRQFRLETSTNGTTFTPWITSSIDAFPGFNPRPVVARADPA